MGKQAGEIDVYLDKYQSVLFILSYLKRASDRTLVSSESISTKELLGSLTKTAEMCDSLYIIFNKF